MNEIFGNIQGGSGSDNTPSLKSLQDEANNISKSIQQLNELVRDSGMINEDIAKIQKYKNNIEREVVSNFKEILSDFDQAILKINQDDDDKWKEGFIINQEIIIEKIKALKDISDDIRKAFSEIKQLNLDESFKFKEEFDIIKDRLNEEINSFEDNINDIVKNIESEGRESDITIQLCR